MNVSGVGRTSLSNFLSPEAALTSLSSRLPDFFLEPGQNIQKSDFLAEDLWDSRDLYWLGLLGSSILIQTGSLNVPAHLIWPCVLNKKSVTLKILPREDPKFLTNFVNKNYFRRIWRADTSERQKNWSRHRKTLISASAKGWIPIKHTPLLSVSCLLDQKVFLPHFRDNSIKFCAIRLLPHLCGILETEYRNRYMVDLMRSFQGFRRIF